MLTPADFLRTPTPGNRGRLSLGMFPGYTEESLTAFLAALIENAATEPRVVAADEADRDRLVMGYVYWQAYDEALWLLASKPTETMLADLGSRKVDVKTLIGLVQGWQKAALAMWEGPAEPVVVVDENPSVSVNLSPSW